jgi:hypothetical protein
MSKQGYQPGAASRIAVSAMVVWATSIGPVTAQTPAPPPAPPGDAAPANQVYSVADLEYLLGPIALYPDPLIALILPASTFPLQIVQADRWLAANADAVKANDFSGADAQSWDSSVIALVRFPDVIEMMADHLDWTQSLAAAFSQQPQDVANAIQLLRAQAQKAGNLASTPQQRVTTRQEGGAPVIFIEPAEPESSYVPVYDPGVIFTTAVATGLIFGPAFFVGSYWNNRWGWNNRNWNTIWIDRPVWRPGRPGGPPPGAWRPGRPGTRPDRPGVRPPGGRPDRPGRPGRPGDGRPDRPGRPGDGIGRPDRPGGGRPDRPGVVPGRPGDRPGVRPDRPGVRPDRPGDRPGARPDRPGDRPGARPDRPGDRPGARPDRPGDRPGARPDRPGDRPGARPDRPQARPPQARPPQARPGGGRPPQARPPQARPPQARPPQARPPAARPPQARPPQARPNRPPQARPARPQARPQGRPNRPAGNPNRGNRGRN